MTFSFGATKEEAQIPLPGDDIVGTPLLEITRAITINAPAERIWRWLIQKGQGRAGFYSDSPWWDAAVDFYYRVLSREQSRPRVRYEKRDTGIVPEWQDLRIGDAILDGPAVTAYLASSDDASRVNVSRIVWLPLQHGF
jgi:hypothetical protein